MQRVTFAEVCSIFDTADGISSRNDMTILLSEFYKRLDSEDAQILSYIILGRVAPSFVNSEFNYSEKSFLNLLDSLLKVKNLDLKISSKRAELGDIGETLQYFSSEVHSVSKGISLFEIYEILWSIVNTKGNGSIERKNSIIIETLKNLSPVESKYFARIVCGSLRFGINAKTLLDVFSYILKGDKTLRGDLDRAYGYRADIGFICSKVVQQDSSEVERSLKAISLVPGIPVMARLVERVGSFEEVFERFEGEFLVQPKFDGLRCQIHKYKREDFVHHVDTVWIKYMEQEKTSSLFSSPQENYEVRLFTRNLEDVTLMFPEIVASAKEMDETFILDSEVMGWSDGKFLSFQDTMQRRRKHEVKSLQKDIPVKAMCFDLLYFQGNSLLEEHTEKRVQALENLKCVGSIDVCKTEKVSEISTLKETFDRNVKEGKEGIIVKQKNGSYLPGVRNYQWIKLKKSMITALVDTIDLVAIGYYLGSGKRAGFGVGAVLGALYNDKEDRFEGICKVGTGFSDSLLSEIAKDFEGDILLEKPLNIVFPKGLDPDKWVVPRVVFTVEADEVTRRITASKEDPGEGLSLRFPRLIEWGRDKSITEATTVGELKQIFETQKHLQSK